MKTYLVKILVVCLVLPVVATGPTSEPVFHGKWHRNQLIAVTVATVLANPLACAIQAATRPVGRDIREKQTLGKKIKAGLSAVATKEAWVSPVVDIVRSLKADPRRDITKTNAFLAALSAHKAFTVMTAILLADSLVVATKYGLHVRNHAQWQKTEDARKAKEAEEAKKAEEAARKALEEKKAKEAEDARIAEEAKKAEEAARKAKEIRDQTVARINKLQKLLGVEVSSPGLEVDLTALQEQINGLEKQYVEQKAQKIYLISAFRKKLGVDDNPPAAGEEISLATLQARIDDLQERLCLKLDADKARAAQQARGSILQDVKDDDLNPLLGIYVLTRNKKKSKKTSVSVVIRDCQTFETEAQLPKPNDKNIRLAKVGESVFVRLTTGAPWRKLSADQITRFNKQVEAGVITVK